MMQTLLINAPSVIQFLFRSMIGVSVFISIVSTVLSSLVSYSGYLLYRNHSKHEPDCRAADVHCHALLVYGFVKPLQSGLFETEYGERRMPEFAERGTAT